MIQVCVLGLIVLLCSCWDQKPLAGGSTTVENGVMALVGPDGKTIQAQIELKADTSKWQGMKPLSVSIDPLGRPWIAGSRAGLWFPSDTLWTRMLYPNQINVLDTLTQILFAPTTVPGTLGLQYLIQSTQGPYLFEDGDYLSLDSAIPTLKGKTKTGLAYSGSGWSVLSTSIEIYARPNGGVSWTELGMGGASCLALLQDTAWISTPTGQVWAVDLVRKQTQTLGTLSPASTKMLRGKMGLFAANTLGLWQWNGARWQEIPGTGDSIRQLVEDSLGRLWALQGSRELAMYDGVVWRVGTPWNTGDAPIQIAGSARGVAVIRPQGLYQITSP